MIAKSYHFVIQVFAIGFLSNVLIFLCKGAQGNCDSLLRFVSAEIQWHRRASGIGAARNYYVYISALTHLCLPFFCSIISCPPSLPVDSYCSLACHRLDVCLPVPHLFIPASGYGSNFSHMLTVTSFVSCVTLIASTYCLQSLSVSPRQPIVDSYAAFIGSRRWHCVQMGYSLYMTMPINFHTKCRMCLPRPGQHRHEHDDGGVRIGKL